MSTTTHWSLDHEVKINAEKKTLLHICKILCKYSVHLLGWKISLALQVSELSPPSHFHLPSSPCQRLLTLMSHKSRTYLVHCTPLDSILFHRFQTWSHKPQSKHQALAPSLPILLSDNWMFATVLLTFNASARACGQKRCQTMWNLRTYKAIYHNIAMSHYHTLKPRSRGQDKTLKKNIAPYL